MQEKNILLCFLALPLRHKLVAAGIAVAIASGFIVWSRHGAARPTTAEVLFDVDEARQVEPAAVQAKEPAIAVAFSILNDEAVKALAKRTGATSDVAVFRSRLEMAQHSANLLEVNYRDGDKEVSATTANAIANLLVTWKPSTTGPNPAPAVPAPVALVTAAQATATLTAPSPAVSHRPGQSVQVRSSEINDLERQLTSLDQKLSALTPAPLQTTAPAKADTTTHVVNPESEQRRSLEAQLGAAEKRLDDLRVRYTDDYPDVETAKEKIAEIQQQLAALPTGNHETEQPTAPVKQEDNSSEVSQLREERARLVQAIAEEKRRPVTHGNQAVPDENWSRPTQAVSSTPRLQPAPVHQSVNPAAAPIPQSPFTLVRLAGYSEPSSPWHGVLAGILCGFLYLSSAVWGYLPIAGALPKSKPVAFNNDLGAGDAKSADDSRDLASWESEIKMALAMTNIGREEEPLLQRQQALIAHEAVMAGPAEVMVCGPEVNGQLCFDEVSEAIREKARREPDGWMAHTEHAREALAGGDYDTAIKEISMATTIAPEKMKPRLDKIAVQLNKNAAHLHKSVSMMERASL